MHLAKFGKPEFSKIYAHWAREKDKDGNYVTYQTEDEVSGHIHRENTKDNFTLGEIHDRNWVVTRLEHVYQKPGQKHPIQSCDIVFTLPKDEDPSLENVRQIMQAAYNILLKMYGKNNNVIGCWVHMDESQPHMHFAFLPIADRQSKQKPEYTEKLSTRAYWPRKNSLQMMHRTLQIELDAAMGRHIDVLSGVTKDQGGNKTITQLKSETQKQHEHIEAQQKKIEKYASTRKEEMNELVGEHKKPLVGEEYYKLTPHQYKRLRTLAGLSIDQQEQYELITRDLTRLTAENTRLNTENKQMHERVIHYRKEQADKYRQQIADAEAERDAVRADAKPYLDVPDHQRHTINTMIRAVHQYYQRTVALVASAAIKTMNATNNLAKSVQIMSDALHGIGIDDNDRMQWCLRARHAAQHPDDQHQTQGWSNDVNDVSEIPNYGHTLKQEDSQILGLILSKSGAATVQQILDEDGGAWSLISALEKNKKAEERDKRQAQR